MNTLIKLLSMPTIIIMLAACGGSDNNPSSTPTPTATPTPTPTPMAKIRVFHGSPDAPAVNVSLNGNVALTNVDYATSSGLLDVNAGTNSVQVDGLLPNEQTTTVIGPADLDFEVDTRNEILAVNALENIEPIVVSRPEAFDDTMVRVTVLHGAHSAPRVDVHVTAPDAELSVNTVLGSFSFRGTLGPVEIAPADYRIRVTLEGTTTVVYDSGTLSLAAGTDVFASAVVNPVSTGNDRSPIALLVAANDGAANIVYSSTDGSDLRVVHNSADAPAVDVVANDNFAMPLVSNLAFPNFTDYLNVPADSYNIKVAATSTMMSVIDEDITLDNGTAYSVIALNNLANIEPLVLVDNTRTVATEARVRVIHGSSAAGTVDVYVTEPMADISNMMPNLSNIELRADSGFLGLAAGSYDVSVTIAGTKDIAIGPAQITVEAGKIYTIIARDGMNLSGFGLTLLDDFNN